MKPLHILLVLALSLAIVFGMNTSNVSAQEQDCSFEKAEQIVVERLKQEKFSDPWTGKIENIRGGTTGIGRETDYDYYYETLWVLTVNYPHQSSREYVGKTLINATTCKEMVSIFHLAFPL